MNKQWREAQYKIVKIREEKRISDDRSMKHFKEWKPARENACVALSNTESKLKRNATLYR